MNQTEVKNLNDFEIIDFLGIKWKRAIEADMPLEFCNALHKDFKDASMYVWAHYKVNDESQLKYHNFAEKYNSLDKNDALYYLETRKENKEILSKVREEATKAYNNGLFTQDSFKFNFEKDEYRNNLNEINRRNNEGSLVGIVNSDTPTQDEMDELAQNALLANLDETISQNPSDCQTQTTRKRRK